MFSVKSQICRNDSTLLLQCKSSHRQQMGVAGFQYNFTDTNFHMSGNFIHLLIFFQPFKNVNSILSLQPIQTGGGPDLAHGPQVNDP